MHYKEILQRLYAKCPEKLPERLLALDPGETTGWSLWVDGQYKDGGQLETVVLSTESQGVKVLNWAPLKELFVTTKPTLVVYENYRIYSHKLDRHSFSEVETLRLIGGIDLICWEESIPVANQMAVQAKSFITDDKLKAWDFWLKGLKHSRDSMRHALYYIIVTAPKLK